MAVLQAVGDWIMWAVGAALTFVGVPTGGVILKNRERSKENQRRLEGDPDDDNYPGLMAIAYDNNQKLDNLEERMDREHREVMARLEEIQGTAGGDEHFSD